MVVENVKNEPSSPSLATVGHEEWRFKLEEITLVHAMFSYLWELDGEKRLMELTFWWLW